MNYKVKKMFCGYIPNPSAAAMAEAAAKAVVKNIEGKARVAPHALESLSEEFLKTVETFVDTVYLLSKGASISIDRHAGGVAVHYTAYPTVRNSLEPFNGVKIFPVDNTTVEPSISAKLKSYLLREAKVKGAAIEDMGLEDLAKTVNAIEALKVKSDGLFVELHREDQKLVMRYTMLFMGSKESRAVTGKAYPLERDPSEMIRLF